MRAITFANKF